mmetsp:Transcript_44687/g.140050  ORF Transcript_44687/g.140050 Transcript_44687/m.140050 type:complete len:236 (+) Transcript_44687:852-1559(+)
MEPVQGSEHGPLRHVFPPATIICHEGGGCLAHDVVIRHNLPIRVVDLGGKCRGQLQEGPNSRREQPVLVRVNRDDVVFTDRWEQARRAQNIVSSTIPVEESEAGLGMMSSQIGLHHLQVLLPVAEHVEVVHAQPPVVAHKGVDVGQLRLDEPREYGEGWARGGGLLVDNDLLAMAGGRHLNQACAGACDRGLLSRACGKKRCCLRDPYRQQEGFQQVDKHGHVTNLEGGVSKTWR